jgi:hypothetical protein
MQKGMGASWPPFKALPARIRGTELPRQQAMLQQSQTLSRAIREADDWVVRALGAFPDITAESTAEKCVRKAVNALPSGVRKSSH